MTEKWEGQVDNTSYQEVRYKTVLALLKTIGVEVNDFNGLVQVKKDGELIGSVTIAETPKLKWVEKCEVFGFGHYCQHEDLLSE